MNKGCYTCRRRRITCDNGLPTCRKCRDAGKECLGYQKPLVWVKGGVASRGKMMGRSFDDVMKKNSRTETSSFGSSTASGSVAAEAPNQLPESQGHYGMNGDSSLVALQPAAEGLGSGDDNSLVYAEDIVPTGYFPIPEYIPAPWGLVDPLVKDLSPLSRFYIYHCMSDPFYPVSGW